MRVEINLSGSIDQLTVTVNDLSLFAEPMEKWAINWLTRHRGYKVAKDLVYETPSELCKRLGIHPEKLRRRLQASPYKPADISYSTSGNRSQIRYIASTPELDAHLVSRTRKTNTPS